MNRIKTFSDLHDKLTREDVNASAIPFIMRHLMRSEMEPLLDFEFVERYETSELYRVHLEALKMAIDIDLYDDACRVLFESKGIKLK